MPRSSTWTILAAVLVALATLCAADASSAEPDSQWPPKPVAALQPAYGQTTPAPGLFSGSQPTPAAGPLLDSPTLATPSLVMPSQPIAPPFQLPDGTVITGDGGMPHIFDAVAPQFNWTFRADALWLQRTIGTDNRLGGLRDSSTHTFIEHLDSNDASFGMEPGMRLQLTRRLNSQMSLEVIWFGLQNWSGRQTLFADPVNFNTLAFSPYTQTDKLLNGFDTSLRYVDNSGLRNFEINLTQTRVDFGDRRWGTLAGFRYFEFSDLLHISGVDTSPPAYENVHMFAYNYLFGGQLGGFYTRDWNRFHLTGTGKLGLMANVIHLRESNLHSSGNLNGSPAGFVPYDVSADRVGVAGVLDFSAMASYEVRSNIVLRAGYQMLYVPGVALAPNQLDGIVHQGGVFFHGPSAGLEVRW